MSMVTIIAAAARSIGFMMDRPVDNRDGTRNGDYIG